MRPSPAPKLDRCTSLCIALAVTVLLLAASNSHAKVTAQRNKPAPSLSSLSLAAVEKRAESGDARAQIEMGSRYMDGRGGVQADYAQALAWFRKPAAQGNPVAENNVGYIYESGRGVPVDYTQALAWFRKSADQGNAGAELNLATMYEDGKGVPQDLGESAKWYRKAADQGVAPAQNDLGFMYEKGRGVPVDYSQAQVWFRKAANQGYAEAQSNLGYMFEHGLGVAVDYAEALADYRKAAGQDNVDAELNLASMYQHGQGMPVNYQEAANWYQKAANQGNPFAENQLGCAYARGQGVPRDYTAATFWLKKAVAGGYPQAPQNLATVQKWSAAMQNQAQASQQNAAAAQPANSGPTLKATLDWVGEQLQSAGESYTVHRTRTTVGQYVNDSHTDDSDTQISYSNFQENPGGKACALSFQEDFRGATGSFGITWDLAKMTSGASVIEFDNTKEFSGAPWNGSSVDTMGGTGGFTMTNRTAVSGDRTVYLVEPEPDASRSGTGQVSFTGISGPLSNMFDLVFRDRQQAERVASALDHAVQLCGGNPASFQQQAVYPQWNPAAPPIAGASQTASASDSDSEQANEADQKQQEIQDKIGNLNRDIESLESQKQNDEQLAEQSADYSNCSSAGYGTFAAIGAAGCRTADEIAEAKAKEAVNQDANKIDDDRAEIARLQGEEVEEAPHRDASFAGALNQVSQENGQTSIQDTANQQAANMIALGAANDAARAQAAEQATQNHERGPVQQAESSAYSGYTSGGSANQRFSIENSSSDAFCSDCAAPPPSLLTCIHDIGVDHFSYHLFRNTCDQTLFVLVTGPLGITPIFHFSPGAQESGTDGDQPYRLFVCPDGKSPVAIGDKSVGYETLRYECGTGEYSPAQ